MKVEMSFRQRRRDPLSLMEIRHRLVTKALWQNLNSRHRSAKRMIRLACRCEWKAAAIEQGIIAKEGAL